jgi:hypothetical protein
MVPKFQVAIARFSRSPPYVSSSELPPCCRVTKLLNFQITVSAFINNNTRLQGKWHHVPFVAECRESVTTSAQPFLLTMLRIVNIQIQREWERWVWYVYARRKIDCASSLSLASIPPTLKSGVADWKQWSELSSSLSVLFSHGLAPYTSLVFRTLLPLPYLARVPNTAPGSILPRSAPLKRRDTTSGSETTTSILSHVTLADSNTATQTKTNIRVTHYVVWCLPWKSDSRLAGYGNGA